MRLFLLLLCLLISMSTWAQVGYTDQTYTALQTMWKAKTDAETQKALDMYEAAFAQFPDSLDAWSVYKSAVLAGRLKELDKAFGYLDKLWKLLESDQTGWEYWIGDYVKGDYENLIGDARWTSQYERATEARGAFFKELAEAETEFRQEAEWQADTSVSPEKLYAQLQHGPPFLTKQEQDYSLRFAFNDTAQTSYFVHLPADYDPARRYPLLFFLHGAVFHNKLADYQTRDQVLTGWNRYYAKYAAANEVIMVFPQGSKEFNWMRPDDGFRMVPDILREIRRVINVDEDRVFITGHSNGATGSFSYWMKDPTPFAGFFGFNTFPRVFTGGTFIQNGRNRSFVNFSTDQDYYYPPWANDSMSQLTGKLDIAYEDIRYEGFPHWFPEFDESEPAYKILFERIEQVRRHAFPDTIYWALDDPAYNQVDWLIVSEMDTTRAPEEWHIQPNFHLTSWLDYNDADSLVEVEIERSAFVFPRPAAAAQALYADNRFDLQTSRIQSVRLLISPEMVDMDRPVEVWVNGKKAFQGMVKWDKALMAAQWERSRDRSRVWGGSLEVDVPAPK